MFVFMKIPGCMKVSGKKTKDMVRDLRDSQMETITSVNMFTAKLMGKVCILGRIKIPTTVNG